MEGRRPVSGVGAFRHSDLIHDPAYIRRKLARMNPDANYGLGICRVVELDYEEHYVTLRAVIGSAQEFERVPVPMSYPGAGARHFLGAMPEIGDYCVVGWMPQETSEPDGGSRTPVILSWVIPGVWPGRDWAPTAGYTEDEHDSGTHRNREEVRGVADRVRHKLRHLHPGMVVASSSQGSDLVLDEGVILSNRRGNEFRLRDADQAAVLRTLQFFAAHAGVRAYHGMVQRDALQLPSSMFSDGRQWDALLGEPTPEDALPASSAPRGALTPDPVFQRTLASDGSLGPSMGAPPDHLDPYTFLRNGGYIDERGFSVDTRNIPDAVAAGKSIYRIGLGRGNAALEPGASALTEFNLEIDHTSDGTLPVTEQTDGFDADRLPDSDPDAPRQGRTPFIKFILGSVVGNDPFTREGRAAYGLPLTTRIFDPTGGLSPVITPAVIVPEGTPGGTPLGDHAATLFSLTPLGGRLAPTWWSLNKKGQFRVNISGPTNEHSLDVAVAGGIRLASGGGLELLLQGGLHFGTISKDSVRLTSSQGPVVLYGGGPDRDSGPDAPSVDIQAKTNLQMRAARAATLQAQSIEVDARQTLIQGQDSLTLRSARALSVEAEDVRIISTGKRSDVFSGPKNLLPTNGALHERTYAPLLPGVVAEEVTYVQGDREELFLLGNHTTSILIGNLTYETELGSFEARALQNRLTVDPTGLSATATTGNVSLQAVSGAASLRATVGVLVEASAGGIALRSSTGIYLGAPITGPDVGPILTAGSLEPFTGLPFGTWGLGARNHLIGG